MIHFILGTSKSGKSKKAEDLALSLSEKEDRYYLATMIPYDEDGYKRIENHRRLRKDKGFVTLEIPYNISTALEYIDEAEKKLVLLECISNLVGNEIYENKDNLKVSCEDLDLYIAEKIKNDLLFLASKVKELVIVSNKFVYDKEYDEATLRYIKITDLVNDMLLEIADRKDLSLINKA